LNGQMSEAYLHYVQDLERRLSELYAISDKAREKGLDPSLKTECKVAKDLADLVEGLVGPKGVAESIRELNSKLPREELAFKIAEQIVYGKFGHMEPEAAAEQSIRRLHCRLGRHKLLCCPRFPQFGKVYVKL